MRPLLLIARTLVGSLFVVSGLIKANDTLGFSYKLEKYFAEQVFDLPFLMDYALLLAVLIALVEVFVGFATLLGTRMKEISWLLLLMILFFTWLTFYSAYYGVVKDCGCFGEALKLTPWESFSKNLVLLVLILLIFIGRKRIVPNEGYENLAIIPASLLLIGLFSKGLLDWWFPFFFALLVFAVSIIVRKILGNKLFTEWIQIGTYILFTVLFSAHTLYYLPIRDFRPYAEGKSIPEQMSVPEDQQPVYKSIFVYEDKKSGETITVPQDSLGELAEKWSYKDRTTKKIKEGKTPAIQDFDFFDGDEDVTHKIIGVSSDSHRTGYVFLAIAYDLKKTDASAFSTLNRLYEKADSNGHSFFGATATMGDRVFEFRQEHRIEYPMLKAGGVLLKTIVRSNPGLVLLKDGKVLAKWPSTDLPGYAEIKNGYIEAERD
jgi:uncharacterized membrane protein YphA (DoxX/SURF4 family)